MRWLRAHPGLTFLSATLTLIVIAVLVLPRLSSGTGLPALIQNIRTLSARGDGPALADLLDRTTVSIPAGAFLRGSDTAHWDERPARPITLDGFAIDRFEVTNAQFQRFLLATSQPAPPYWTGTAYPTDQADYPVTGVTWEQAAAYCRWAGKRLPTEAEWEKACRGTDGRLYPWGNTWDASNANLDPLAGSSERQPGGAEAVEWDAAYALLRSTHTSPGSCGLRPVGSYPAGASPYGVLDMAGNASEWVADWYAFADYSQLPDHNPRTTGPEWNHALRGSAWYDPNGSPAWSQDLSRCSARNSSHDTRDPRVGFRCAISHK